MVGLKTTLPLSFTDTAIPRLRDDPALPDSGALLLVDPSHVANPWATGIPAQNATVANIAQTQAATLEGVTAANTLASFASTGLGGGGAATALGKIERTPKGGLHIIVSQDNTKIPDNTGNSAFGQIYLPAALKAYVVAHQTNSFYVSQWFRPTRSVKAGAGSTWRSTIANSISSTGRWLSRMDNGGSNQGNGTSDNSGSVAANVGNGTNGIIRASNRGVGFASNPPADYTSVLGYALMIGNGGTVNSYLTAATGSPSGVFYRYYIEDLTVSGRTYSQVDALDLQEFTAAFAIGGRYYGDTIPTDPTTIP